MIRAARALLALAPLLAFAVPAEAAREPVLSQVKHPHNYYWRELYIPQLTTGPSSVAFMPSGEELIYAMEGSLWRRKIGTPNPANQEVTHPAAAYDHQPDVAPDGQTVIFTRYDGKGFELWRHDLASRHGATPDLERRRQPGAPHLAERPPDRFRFDRRHRSFQPQDRRPRQRRTRE